MIYYYYYYHYYYYYFMGAIFLDTIYETISYL